jgi:beta-lactam-binding protein with PASTA domain
MVEHAPGSRRTVPPVHDLTVAEAAAVLRDAGFRPVAIRRRFGGADLTALVRGTIPPEGGAVFPGGRVDLLPVHKAADEEAGPTPEQLAIDQGIMPDLKGWPAEDAAAVFPSGIAVLWRFGYDRVVGDGLVTNTDPRPNTTLGGLVVLWVSEGPGPPAEDGPPDLPKEIQTPIPDDFLEH